MRPRLWRLAAAALAAAAISAAGTAAGTTREDTITDDLTEHRLTGRWLKTTTDACAARYPAELLLRPGGLYEAPGGPEAGAVWHSGEWRLDGDAAFIIQMANDEMRPYRLIASNADQLAIADADGCRVDYRRAPE